FFLALLIDGALAGAIYALIALIFVLAYKSSRVVNFALGEWITTGALLVAVGQLSAGLGLVGAILPAAAGVAVFGVVVNTILGRSFLSSAVISPIMITIGLGAMMRGVASLLFAGAPSTPKLPPPLEPLMVQGVPIVSEKAITAATA